MLAAAGDAVSITNQNTFTRTVGGPYAQIAVIGQLAPTSGTYIWSAMEFRSIINQTGGANGISRGIYLNPTLTSAADWRSIETSNNTGFSIYTAGTAKSYFGGNVGIGTTAPLATLDIGAQTTGSTFMVSSAGGNATHGDYVTVTSTGMVGIGTTSPGRRLQVVISSNVTAPGASGLSQAFRLFNTDVTDANTLGMVFAGAPTAGGTDTAVAGIFSVFGDRGAGSISSDLAFYTRQTTGVITERMRVMRDGNVGIGTTAPVAILEVAGGNIQTTNAQYNGFYFGAAGSRSIVSTHKARGTSVAPQAVAGTDRIGTFGFVGYDGTTWDTAATLDAFVDGTVYSGGVPMRLAFSTGNNTNDRSEKMTIKYDGNVGIGTATPAAKLDVNGDVRLADGTKFVLAHTGTNNDMSFRNTSSLVDFVGTAAYPDSGTDVAAALQVVPRGTGYFGIRAQLAILNTDFLSDPSNYEGLVIRAKSTSYEMLSITNGGGMQLWPIIIDATGSTVAGGNTPNLYLDTVGNVAMGTTAPKARLQVGAGLNTVSGAPALSGNDALITGNLVVDGKIYGNGGGITNLGAATGWTVSGQNVYTSLTGNVGIGSTAPRGKFDVQSDWSGVNAGNVLGLFTGYADAGRIVLRRANGAMATPGAVAVNDVIGVIAARGFSTAFAHTSNNASITMLAEENFTGTNQGTGMTFWTTSLGTTANNEKMRISANGNVGIGTITPAAKLDVNGDVHMADGAKLIMAHAGTNRDVYLYNWGMIDDFGLMGIYPASGANIAMSWQVSPRGTGWAGPPAIRAQVSVFGTDVVADAVNYEFASLRSSGADYGIIVGTSGTGQVRPFFLDATGGQTAATSNLYLATDGNVAIGTITPKQKLEVNGGDIYINHTSSKLIMKKPDGNCSACGPDNADVWVCSAVACP
jgi:hypothetical protein